jgi:hypothetical protein
MSKVENVTAPTCGLIEYSGRALLECRPGRLKRDGIEIALQDRACPKAPPRTIEIDAPVDADDIATRLLDQF